MSSLTILEATNLKSVCQQHCFLLGALKEILFQTSLLSSGSFRQFLICGIISQISAPNISLLSSYISSYLHMIVSFLRFSPLLRRPVTLNEELTLLHHDLTLTYCICNNPISKIWPHSEVLSVRSSTHLFGKYNSTYHKV